MAKAGTKERRHLDSILGNAPRSSKIRKLAERAYKSARSAAFREVRQGFDAALEDAREKYRAQVQETLSAAGRQRWAWFAAGAAVGVLSALSAAALW